MFYLLPAVITVGGCASLQRLPGRLTLKRGRTPQGDNHLTAGHNEPPPATASGITRSGGSKWPAATSQRGLQNALTVAVLIDGTAGAGGFDVSMLT